MRAANVLIVAGAVALAAGLLWRAFPGIFSWFGNLPGDIRIEGERGGFYAPITSMLLVSIAVSLVVSVIARLR